jgi:sulfur carrier protein
MNVIVNGAPVVVADSSTVADLLAATGVGLFERGVAVAVSGVVVRRADWAATVLVDGARVEILRATAGG